MHGNAQSCPSFDSSMSTCFDFEKGEMHRSKAMHRPKWIVPTPDPITCDYIHVLACMTNR